MPACFETDYECQELSAKKQSIATGVTLGIIGLLLIIATFVYCYISTKRTQNVDESAALEFPDIKVEDEDEESEKDEVKPLPSNTQNQNNPLTLAVATSTKA